MAAHPPPQRDAATGALTMAGDVIGTPGYMPPEQARGKVAEMDARADIFALGGILYCALTGQDPYKGRSMLDTLASAYGWKLIDPRKRAPGLGVPPELAAIAMKAMARDPANRYATADEMVADIAAYETNRPVTAHRDGALQRLVKFTRRHPTTVMVATVTLLLLSVLGVVVSVMLAEREAVARAEAEQRQRADEAEREKIRALAAEGRWQDIGERLGVTIRQRTDNARRDYYDLVRKLKAEGLTDSEAVDRIVAMGGTRYFIHAFRKLMIAGEEAGTADVTPDDYYHYGSLLLGMREYDRAIEELQHAIDLEPRMAKAWSQLGVAFDRSDQVSEAARAFAKAAGLQPRQALHHYNLGTLELRHEIDDHGLAEFSKAIELRDMFGEAYVARAHVHLNAGRYNEAVEDITTAIRCGITSLSAFRVRGSAHEQLKNYPAAIADYTAAIELQPGDADVYYHRGRARQRHQQYAAAWRDLQAALRIEPQHLRALVAAAQTSFAMKEWQRTLELADKACKLDPDDVPARRIRGLVLQVAGRHRRALQDFDFAIEHEPTELIHYHRAVSRQATGDLQGAIADYSVVIGSDSPASSAYSPEACFNRGLLQVQANHDAPAGLRDAQLAVRLRPDWWKAHDLEGNCQLAIAPRNARAALACFRRARDLLTASEPQHPDLARLTKNITALEHQSGE